MAFWTRIILNSNLPNWITNIKLILTYRTQGFTCTLRFVTTLYKCPAIPTATIILVYYNHDYIIMQPMKKLSESIPAIKSVVEMMIKREERGAQDQLQDLVFNDSCSWVRKYGNLLLGNRYNQLPIITG